MLFRSAHGVADTIGSVEVGKFADLVLWDPAFFGVKPEMVIKGGQISMSAMGDSNGSIPTPQPVTHRPMFGAWGNAMDSSSLIFMPTIALEEGLPDRIGLKSDVAEAKNVRNLSKADMKLNSTTADIKVDPETYNVTIDGELITSEPAKELPMAQRYFLF